MEGKLRRAQKFVAKRRIEKIKIIKIQIKWQSALFVATTLRKELERFMCKKTQRFYTSAHQSVKKTM